MKVAKAENDALLKAERELADVEEETPKTSAERQNSAQSSQSGSAKSKDRNSGKKDTRKKKGGGIRQLSKEDQQDLEELEREEKYQRAEQKKIQVHH